MLAIGTLLVGEAVQFLTGTLTITVEAALTLTTESVQSLAALASDGLSKATLGLDVLETVAGDHGVPP